MKICNLKNRCFVRGFRQFSAHRTKCHDCHGNCTLSPLDAALPMRFTKNTQHDTSKVLRLPRKMTMDTSKVLRLPRNLPRMFAKRRQSIAPATQNDFRHVTERCWMSRSATPATRNEATRCLKPPKMIPPAELPIGTAIRSSHEQLRTVADGCGRERNVERTHPHFQGFRVFTPQNPLSRAAFFFDAVLQVVTWRPQDTKTLPKRPCAQILGFGVGYPLSRGADSLAQCPSGTWAQTGRFPMVREGNFNCRAKGPEMAEICCQKAPSQVSVVGTGTHHVTSCYITSDTHKIHTHAHISHTQTHTCSETAMRILLWNASHVHKTVP